MRVQVLLCLLVRASLLGLASTWEESEHRTLTKPLAAELVEVLLEGELATGVAALPAWPLAQSLEAASAAALRGGA